MFRARTEKISFAEAEEFVRSGRLEGLGRSLQQEEHYSEQTSQLKREWSSVSDYILHDKFAFDFVKENGFKKVIRPLPELPPCERISLQRNDHPYFFEDDVEHFVLWKLGSEAVAQEEISSAAFELKSQKNGDMIKWISFQNPPALMSIPEVHHAHILVHMRRVAES